MIDRWVSKPGSQSKFILNFYDLDMISNLIKWFTGSTEQKSSPREEPREVTSAYEMFFKRSPLPQALTSKQGIFLDVNDAYCHLHGIERQAIIGKSPVSLGFATEDEISQILDIFSQHQNRLDGYLLKYHVQQSGLLYVRVFAHIIRLRGEEVILMVLDNITEQRLAEKAVKESERFIHTIINSIPIRVFWKDKNSVFQGANQLVADDAGLGSTSELIGKSDYEIFEKDQADLFVRDDQQVMAKNERKLFFEELQPQPDGTVRWKMTSKVPLHDSAGQVIGLLGIYDDITDRKRAEAELKLAWFSIENATSSIVWISRNAQIRDFNPAFNKMLQYSRDELLNLTVPDIDPNYTKEKWPKHWEDLKQQHVLTFFTKQIRKDGKLLDVEVTAHYLEYEGVEYNCAFVNDVTERKQIEDRLLLSNRFLQKVLDTIPAGVFWKDRESKYLGINAIIKAIANVKSDEEVIGKTDYDFPWRENADLLRADDKYVMDNNISKLYYIEPLLNADGRVQYNEVSKVPLLNAEGEVMGVLGTFRDITSQKEIEEALRQSEKLFKGVVQNASAIIYVIDKEGIFQLSEGLGLAVLGLKPGQIIGTSVFEMYKDFPEITEPIRKALKGESVENEVSIGGLTFASRFTPMRDENGVITSILCVSFDITARKKMEEELAILNNELEQRVALRTEQLLQANQDLESFTYSVSHDLRAPIRHIEGFSRLMHTAIQDPSDDITRHYQRIVDSTGRMSQMIDDLLSFSRLGKKPITKTAVNLDAVISNIVSRLKLDLGNRKVEWQINPLGSIPGDSNLLTLALENVLSNALKYSSVRQQAVIEIGSNRTNNQLEIYVKDNGVGFDMAYSDRLFGVFQRLHSSEEFEGTGIGLANVRQIVLKHHGNIRAEGKVNEGAVFYITFPLT